MYRIPECVGSVFQNPRTQFFNVDTDSEIAFGMENEAVSQAEMVRRVAETACALHVEPHLGRNIFALSGGEKQKIAFASVYAMQPSVYLMDEPSSNLDMSSIGAAAADGPAGRLPAGRARRGEGAVRPVPHHYGVLHGHPAGLCRAEGLSWEVGAVNPSDSRSFFGERYGNAEKPDR